MSFDYDDAHLAAIYDFDNPSGADHQFFCNLADSLNAQVIVDLGCGTGLLTAQLPKSGRTVVGIDPAQAMLDLATRRPGAAAVEWICGTSTQIAANSADLVLMTGNVAMHILLEQWQQTLQDITAGLRPGGVLAFESRNPQARAWLTWSQSEAMRDTPAGPLRESCEISGPDTDGVVTMHLRNYFLNDGYQADFDQRLQFRSFEQIRADLQEAGLEVKDCYQDWHETPFAGGPDQLLMVFVARKVG